MSVAELYRIGYPIAKRAARRFYLPGSDREDVLQEACIALWEATRSYDWRRPWPSYAKTVIDRHLTDCLRTATRKKQRILTDAEREAEIWSDDDPTYATAVGALALEGVIRAVRLLEPREMITLARILLEIPCAGHADEQRRYRLRRKLRTST